jgi:glutamate racemase
LKSIGVFDSGVGGLSVLREIRTLLPADRLVYVADSGHAPYGDRPRPYIKDRVRTILDFLIQEQGAELIVFACNTATEVAIADARARYTVPIVGMEPAIKPAIEQSTSKIVGVLGTTATVHGTRVANLVQRHAGDGRVLLEACPELVVQVERGAIDDAATKSLVRQHVSRMIGEGADVIVLGCTHFHFLKRVIQDIAGTDALVVDPSVAVAKQVARRRPESSDQISAGTESFWTSGPIDEAVRVMSALWGTPVTVSALPRE